MLDTEHRRSILWYLLPIFLGVIGGIIGYFAVRRDDPIMAKRILILGTVIFAIGLLISLMTPVEVPIPSTNTNN